MLGSSSTHCQTAMEKGLTVFAPNDGSFKAKDVPDLSKLTNAELVSLLLCHAVEDSTPISSRKTSNAPISTLAMNSAGKYDFTVKTVGDSVTLNTGVDSSRVVSRVLDSTPTTIFTLNSVLLPVELFGKWPSPAPAPVSPAPGPVAPGGLASCSADGDTGGGSGGGGPGGGPGGGVCEKQVR